MKFAIAMVLSVLSIIISVLTIAYNAANVKRVKAIKQQIKIKNDMDKMKGESHERITDF